MNPSNILKNTEVSILEISMEKSLKGDQERQVNQVLYTNLPAKIESQEVETPIKVAGRDLRKWYNIMIWNQANVDLETIKEGYIILDETNNRQYEILEVIVGHLGKKTVFKIECKCDIQGGVADLEIPEPEV